jgi:hypothetical protein
MAFSDRFTVTRRPDLTVPGIGRKTENVVA